MYRLALLVVRVWWAVVGIALAFSGLWLAVIYFSKSLWYTACEVDMRERRYIGWAGGLLLCAAAAVCIGLL